LLVMELVQDVLLAKWQVHVTYYGVRICFSNDDFGDMLSVIHLIDY